jgi:hypothetical protein
VDLSKSRNKPDDVFVFFPFFSWAFLFQICTSKIVAGILLSRIDKFRFCCESEALFFG